jgi:hypothetical protein
MDDIELHAWLSAVSDELSNRETKTPCFYWHEDDDDEYCRECFDKQYPDLGDSDWGGGHSSVVEDGCVHCAVCGRLLTYYLTDYGAEEELEHFESTEWDWGDSDDCYHIARMLGCWIGWGAWNVEDLPDRERVIKALQNGKNAPVFATA